VIELEGLSREFNGRVAVEGLTFGVEEGEIFGLLGPNGAGKTTTVRMLCSLIRPTRGRARVCGHDVVEEAERVREVVGLLPENPGLYGELSAYENLEFHARLHGLPEGRRRENIERLLRMLDLWERRNDPVATFSRGMQQKLAIVRALLHEPEVLFLDEPTASLSPEAAGVVRDFILELKREGRTIFLCTHNLYEAERLCDRVAILSTRLLALGSPGELKRRFGSPRTEVHLERVTEELVEAVRGLGFVRGVEVEGEKLVVELEDPETQNPSLVEALVRRGGRVRYVTPSPHALEETYLRLVRGSEA
jgi:ABC-2 type transport system ATP-binding protein